jgi:hypothetical protein
MTPLALASRIARLSAAVNSWRAGDTVDILARFP